MLEQFCFTRLRPPNHSDGGFSLPRIWSPTWKSFWLGSHDLFYTDGQPEWTEILARMQGGGGRAEDRETWAALGEEVTKQFSTNWKESKT